MNTLITIVVVLMIIIGLVILIQTLRTKNFDGDTKTLEYKNGLPILPRDERTLNLPNQTMQTDNPPPSLPADSEMASESKADALSNLAKAATQNPADALFTEQNHTTKDVHVEASMSNKMPNEDFLEPSHEFTKNSPILDRHLSEQQTFDQNNDPLLNAKDTVTIGITPRDQYHGLSGKVVLDIVRAYGLKYGVMNMYHRYEREDGTGDLWFSMLGVNHEGVQAFDLNTLADSHFLGLSLFLSLPHHHALRGFDSMVSVAQMIAKDIDADIHDEEGYLLDENYLARIRAQVADYQ